MFNEEHQYTILSQLEHPAVFECRTSTDSVCFICISFPRLAQRSGLSSFYDLHDLNISSSLGHTAPAAIKLLLPHRTSILLTRTEVYGYSFSPVE
jgi:hypothetical protein